MKRCKICLVSAVQVSFWGSQKKEYNNYYLPEMKKLADKLGFELCYLEKPIEDKAGAEAAKTKILEMDPDFLMIQISTFAAGEILLPLAETNLRIGLWGIPEICSTGAIPNNSFCGVNMYASILTQYLGYLPKYKWFYGGMEDELFIDRLSVTVKALTAIKHMRGSTVGLIGGIVPGFYDFCFDERQTARKLGVRVNRLLEFSDVKDRALAYSGEEIAPYVGEMKKEYVRIADDMDSYHIEMSARVYKAFLDLAEIHKLDAIAISCWPKFRKELGIVVCAVIGRLLDHGILAACEGDVDSVITMMMMRDISGQQPMLMDLSKFDEEDQSVLMWHCGSAPNRYANKSGSFLDGHYKPGSHITAADNIRVVGVNNMYYKSMPITAARLTNNYQNLLSFTGEMFDKGDKSFDGSRGWIGKLAADGEPLTARKLVNTVLTQGFQHHFAIVEGHIDNELHEIMAWLDIKPVEYLGYRSYLQTNTL